MPHAEDSRAQLAIELRMIERWEEEQKDLWFWEKIGRYPFALLDKLTPKSLRDWIGQALDELGSYIHTGGQYLIHENSVLDKLAREAGEPPGSLSLSRVPDLPLAVMNRASDQLKESRVEVAKYQGATTGVGGLFTLTVDIPVLLGLSLKTIQEMALAYGYDPREKRERIFIVQCLQFASADYVGKQSILQNLSAFHRGDVDRESFSQLQGWREVLATYRDTFGWKKLFQLVPIAGILFGAWINKSTIEEVAETGQMMYRKRRILEKLEALEQSEPPTQTWDQSS
ncbi:EcsC family protein [Melghirimyces profundicolus]|uniref:EcsC family protein n=1 Tax=Melghirimyces profundicolus TaxID=1242148 RepID=A0A2T6BCE3_9BACL|nr:EcsC family protein [Melghirimyces profundicolus]PTX53745.1 EcsC family protein [Melghirimyces profundicolus]